VWGTQVLVLPPLVLRPRSHCNLMPSQCLVTSLMSMVFLVSVVRLLTQATESNATEIPLVHCPLGGTVEFTWSTADGGNAHDVRRPAQSVLCTM
jgi:hypothetical protein